VIAIERDPRCVAALKRWSLQPRETDRHPWDALETDPIALAPPARDHREPTHNVATRC